jgi:hypothetical protein
MTGPVHSRLLDVSASRRDREQRRAEEIDALNRDAERKYRRVIVQCIALAFLGVPFYGWGMHVDGSERAEIWTALGFAVSYAAPFFRWLAYHTRTSEEFGN